MTGKIDWHGSPTPSWWGATVPPNSVSLSAYTYVGQNISFTVPGRIFGFRIFVAAGSSNDHWAGFHNRTAGGVLLGLKSFKDTVVGGADTWLQAWCHPTIRINTADDFLLWILTTGAYKRHTGQLTSAVVQNGIRFTSGFTTTSINPVTISPSFNTNANGVDVLFRAD